MPKISRWLAAQSPWRPEPRRIFVFLLLLALLLTGCQQPERSYKVALEWSRGQRIGRSAVQEPVALAVSADGGQIALAWPTGRPRQADRIHLLVLDRQGRIVTDRDLPLNTAQPREPRLAVAPDGGFHLTWLDEQENTLRVFHVLLSAQGEPLGPVRSLSPPNYRVRGYHAELLPDGALLVVWAERRGLAAVRISLAREFSPVLLLARPDVFQPIFQVSPDGQVYLAWLERDAAMRTALYAVMLDLATLTPSSPWRLAYRSVGSRVERPVLLLENGQFYVAWTETRLQSGLGGSRSAAGAFYVSVVLTQERATSAPARRITLPPHFPPAYAPAATSFALQKLAAPLPAGASGRASFYTAPAGLEGGRSRPAMALSMWTQTRWGRQLQPALLLLEGGEVLGYQLPAWTPRPSLYPALAADEAGQLYLAWLDARGRSSWDIYLASTAPGLRQAWDRVTRDDLEWALGRLAGRLISILGLTPFAVFWILPSVLWLIVAYFLGWGDLNTSAGRVALGVALWLHWGSRYLLTPGILHTLPQPGEWPLIAPLLTLLAPDWVLHLRWEAGTVLLLGYLLPGFTLLAGILVLRWFTRRRREGLPLAGAYFVVAVVDLFLSLQVYGLAYFNPSRF